MTINDCYQVAGFVAVVSGIGALFGWPVAAIVGGVVVFVGAGIAASREGGRR